MGSVHCICGTEPEVLDRVSIQDHNQHHVSIKCPECQRIAEGGSYIEHYNEGSINAKYNATIMAITAWENLNTPIDLEKVEQDGLLKI